ncbi:MAG TPA: PKD domain-containing protein, partial [Flavisolibacter sp.]
MLRRRILLALFFLLFKQVSYTQYIVNGSAQKNSCNCYTLTQPVQWQGGSVWNSNKVNLTNSFDFWFNVFLGCNDGGADGIVFILQPLSTSIGSSGEGMGFGGVSPSIGIALDTYHNPHLSDPDYDHITIQANGVIAHGSDVAGPVAISAASNNVEDCQWHKLRISWDANTKWLRTYFDGVLRLEKQLDLVGTIFNNDPNVYWGFTGATGGQVNLQQFCTALDPIFAASSSNDISCEGTPVVFTNTSESFAPITNYNWSFGDGTFSTAVNPPPHVYTAPGQYKVTLKITGQDGCERDSSRTITIASNPSADLQVFDTCLNKLPRLAFVSATAGMNFQWTMDGSSIPGNQQPNIPALAAGNHQLRVIVSSNYGCGRPDTADANFSIKPLPEIDAVVADGCAGEQMLFQGLQKDIQTSINRWTWTIDNRHFSTKDVQYQFNQQKEYDIRLWALATNGCSSDTIDKRIKIAKAIVSAEDTSIIKNIPAQLTVSGNGNFQWSPPIGLS